MRGREGDLGDKGNLVEEVGDLVLVGIVWDKVVFVLDGEKQEVSFLVAVGRGNDILLLETHDCIGGFLVREGDSEEAPVGENGV